MVPPALEANLDGIASKLIDLATQLVNHPFRINHPARKTTQLLAVYITDLAQCVPFAYRTGTIQGLTYMPSCAR